MYWPNLKSVAFPILEIIGGTRKNGQSLDTPTLPFLQNFKWTFVRMDPLNVLAKFEIEAFPIPEIIGVPEKFGQSLDIIGTPTLHVLLFGSTL